MSRYTEDDFGAEVPTHSHQREQAALPQDSAARKTIPMARGVLDYFPAALAAVAELSRAGNDKHNPGQDLHHARGKSSDHADCILRHLTDRGTLDPEDGLRHSTKVAWRALALLQEELEAAGAPLARGARLPYVEQPVPWEMPGEILELRGKRYRIVDERVPRDGEAFIGRGQYVEGELFFHGVNKNVEGGVRKIVVPA